jgi:small conductance mechanosensitive channel
MTLKNIEAYQELAMAFAGKLILFVIGIFLTFMVARWVSKIFLKFMKKSQLDETVGIFISKLIRWTVIVLGVISCLGIFGIQTASFAAILAGAGLAVGMALQGTLGNFASGMMILLFRPFKAGDTVTAAGQTGKVTEIDIFNTVLDTPDNRRLIIPNGAVFGSQIENISFHSTRRVEVSVGSDYSADLDQTRAVLEKAMNIDGVLSDPEPAVALTELGDSSVNWKVRVWVNADDFWNVKDALTRSVKYAMDKASIGIPYPQMGLHLSSETIEGLNGKPKVGSVNESRIN